MAPLLAVLCYQLALGDAFALGPLEKNHPLVQKGQDAYQAGKYEDALKAFDEAKKALPQSAAVDLNRGSALYKLGKFEEAKQAFMRAQSSEDKALRAKSHYDLGNTYSQLGERDEAIKSYRQALKLDPTDEAARHNLELALKQKKPPPKEEPKSPPDGGQDGGSDGGGGDGGPSDAGPSDAGGGGSDGGSPDGGPADGGGRPPSPSSSQNDAGTPPPPPEPGLDGGQSSPPPEPEPSLDGGSVPVQGMSREDAERLLDSMKQNEKKLELWRFQQKRQRKANEKDW